MRSSRNAGSPVDPVVVRLDLLSPLSAETGIRAPGRPRALEIERRKSRYAMRCLQRIQLGLESTQELGAVVRRKKSW